MGMISQSAMGRVAYNGTIVWILYQILGIFIPLFQFSLHGGVVAVECGGLLLTGIVLVYCFWHRILQIAEFAQRPGIAVIAVVALVAFSWLALRTIIASVLQNYKLKAL